MGVLKWCYLDVHGLTVTDFPATCTTRLNARIFPERCRTSGAMEQDHDTHIVQALAEIGDQMAPNYSQYAAKYNLVQTTLMRHYKGQTVSRQQDTSNYQ